MHTAIARRFVAALVTITATVACESLDIAVGHAASQQQVFVVRHAERADAGQATQHEDPELSHEGRARAESLAAMLKDADVKAIFVTQYKRTQQTAEPLARALGLQPVVVSARDTAALVEKVRGAGGNVLVVGHSNSVGTTIAALGAGATVTLGDDEYDKLFIVVGDEKPALVRLRFR